jgi:hypothetical protein
VTIPEAALQIDFKTRTVVRRGVVLDHLSGGAMTVRWSEGVDETMEAKARITRTPEGSLVHLQWTDGERWAGLAKNDPGEFVHRFLRGRPEGLTVTTLRKEVAAAGVSGSWLESDYTFTLDRLVEDGFAARDGKRIRPEGILSPDIRALLDDAASASALVSDEHAGDDEGVTLSRAPEVASASSNDTEAAGPSSPVAEPVVRDEGTSTPSRIATIKGTRAPDPKKVAAGFMEVIALPRDQRRHRIDDLTGSVADEHSKYFGDLLAGESTPDGLQALQGAPLVFLKFIGGLPPEVVAEAATMAGHPLARALLTAYPHDAKSIVAPTSGATDDGGKFVAAVEAMMGKLISATRDSQPQGPAKSALRQLVKRAAPVLINEARVSTLVSILDVGATAISKPEERESLLRNVAMLVPDHWAHLDDADRHRLARGAGRFNLRESRARQELVANVFRADKASAATDLWWQGVGLVDLLESGNALASVLSDDAVASAQVRPKLSTAISEVSTRRELFQILGGARPVVETLTPAQVSAAFDRVSRQDEALGRWANEITHSAERAALGSNVERLESALSAAENASTRAQDEIATLTSRVEKAENSVMSLRTEQRELRGAEERQLKIDAMRTLSRLLRLIDSSRIEGIEQLRTRATLLAGREDISPIGKSGSLTTFDPASHASVETDLAPSDGVVVRAPGYVWAHGTERIVLLRADVERQNSEEHE